MLVKSYIRTIREINSQDILNNMVTIIDGNMLCSWKIKRLDINVEDVIDIQISEIKFAIN